jgi:predicted O-linked N-acetylglucosamine transferase (SPINDLY family)
MGVGDPPAETNEALARARWLAARPGPEGGAGLEEAARIVRAVAPTIAESARPLAARILWTAGFYEAAADLGGLEELGRLSVEHGSARDLIYQFPKVRTDEDRFALLRLHRQWGAGIEAAAAARPITRAASATSGKLRLGVLSSDLRQHVIGQLAHPLFLHRDPRFEIYAYTPLRAQPDPPQIWFASRSARFGVLPPDPHDAAQVIANDGVDVLLDLGGPTTSNNPAILAYRPAPVQLSWLGYPHSLGLSAIDRILLERVLAPPRRELLLEEPALLQGSWFAMSPAAFQAEPPLRPTLPADRLGHITFGTANAPYKFSPALLRTWARIVAAVPGSRFRLMRFEAAAPTLQANVRRHFAEEGVAPERLEFPPITGSWRAIYDDVDIALDTFPQTGGMTTAEALWMGAPTVTLCGEAVFERISASLLTSAGLGDLVAGSLEDYVRLAVGLAGARERLRGLRRTLRELVRASPLGDAAGFAQAFYDRIAEVHATVAG